AHEKAGHHGDGSVPGHVANGGLIAIAYAVFRKRKTASVRRRTSSCSAARGGGRYRRFGGNRRRVTVPGLRPQASASTRSALEFRTYVPSTVESPMTMTARPFLRRTRVISWRVVSISRMYLRRMLVVRSERRPTDAVASNAALWVSVSPSNFPPASVPMFSALTFLISETG